MELILIAVAGIGGIVAGAFGHKWLARKETQTVAAVKTDVADAKTDLRKV